MFSFVLTSIYIEKYQVHERSMTQFLYPDLPLSSYFQTAPNIFLAYCFQQSFFTVYKSLKEQNDVNAWKITYRSFAVSATIYFIVTLLSIALFGEELKSDVMHNIARSKYVLKYFCSILFLVIAAMHTPIIFFVGKEKFLTFYTELRYRSLSTNPEHHSMISSTLAAKEYYPITILLYVGVVVAAILIEDLGFVFALCGSFSATTIAFILPPIFYLKLKGSELKFTEKILPMLLLTFGVIFTVIGCYSNLFV